MTSDDLKKIIREQFPWLKKPFFGDDPIMCRDGEYPLISCENYRICDEQAWKSLNAAGITYGENFPDCDDFSDIKLGNFKTAWSIQINSGNIPKGTAPSYAVCDGYNRHGELHDFNLFVCGGVYISDYGNVTNPSGYHPLRIRF